MAADFFLFSKHLKVIPRENIYREILLGIYLRSVGTSKEFSQPKTYAHFPPSNISDRANVSFLKVCVNMFLNAWNSITYALLTSEDRKRLLVNITKCLWFLPGVKSQRVKQLIFTFEGILLNVCLISCSWKLFNRVETSRDLNLQF